MPGKESVKSAANFTRRGFLARGAAALAAAALRPTTLFAAAPPTEFKPMTRDVKPVSRDEYLLRIDKARRLMARHGIGALLIEPGASMVYFTGVHWWRSERLTAVVLPRDGDLAIVTPHFEAPSVSESLEVPTMSVPRGPFSPAGTHRWNRSAEHSAHVRHAGTMQKPT